jgi:hypothetical protein
MLARGIVIDTAADLGGSLGTATRDRIQKLAGLSLAETFFVLAHESAHWLVHHDADRPASRDA